jgi:hypothetical protein
MRDEGIAAPLSRIFDARETRGKRFVTHRKRFVDDQDARRDSVFDGEREAQRHAARID